MVAERPREELLASDRRQARDRVLVIGGGVTGLVAAHRLASQAERPLQVSLLEAKDRVGGAIWTEHRDGFTIEGGADSFLTAKPWAVDLCHQLGLGDRLVGTDGANRRSFVVHRGRLAPVPEGFVLMAPNRLLPVLTTPVLSIGGKLRMLLDLVLPRKSDDAEESLAAFVRRRLGREVLERLVQPLVGGIYTGDPAELSLKATLPQFLELERVHGSLIRGSLRRARAQRLNRHESGARYGMFVSLAEGMGSLPAALAAALPAGTVRTAAAVRRIWKPEAGRPWRVELLDGPPLEAGALVLAIEAHAAARLVDGFDPELALSLRSIPYASSAILNLGFRRDQVAHPLDGFGAVVPAREGRSILAVSFTSVKFPSRAPAGMVLMRVFFGGATQPDLFARDDDELIALARRELAELIGATGEPVLVAMARHPRSMPQYTLGHLDRVAQLRERAARHPGLILAGNYLDGVGIPDCIRSGQQAAATALDVLATPTSAAVA
jgi:oxygen-dependent protoporphyrinogen oxidase